MCTTHFWNTFHQKMSKPNYAESKQKRRNWIDEIGQGYLFPMEIDLRFLRFTKVHYLLSYYRVYTLMGMWKLLKT